MVLTPIEEVDPEEGERLESFDTINDPLHAAAAGPPTRKKCCCCSFLICFLLSLIVAITALLFYGIWHIVVQMRER